SVTAEEVTEMGARLTRVTITLADPAALQASAEMNAVNVALPAVKKEEPLPVVTVAAAEATGNAGVPPSGRPEAAAPAGAPPALPTAAEPVVTAEAIPLAKARTLKKIETSGSGASIEVQLAAAGDIAYNAFKLANPARVVVDLNGIKDKLPKNVVEDGGDLVKKIRVEQFKSAPDPV